MSGYDYGMASAQRMNEEMRNRSVQHSLSSSSDSLKDIKRTLVEIKEVLEKLVKVVDPHGN